MKKVISLLVGLSLVPALALANSTVTTSVDAHSSVSPSGSVLITTGNSQIFTIGAFTGFHVDVVAFDGIAKGALSTYTAGEDGSDHTLAVTSASNGGGGLIFCSGPMAPGWIVGAAGGGCGTSTYVPFNGLSCPFLQGCILPKQ